LVLASPAYAAVSMHGLIGGARISVATPDQPVVFGGVRDPSPDSRRRPWDHYNRSRIQTRRRIAPFRYDEGSEQCVRRSRGVCLGNRGSCDRRSTRPRNCCRWFPCGTFVR
jgi:hypothetical protein